MAELPPDTRSAIHQLSERGDVDLGVISGRTLADVRGRVDIAGIAYAGNHGMEIEGPGISRVHPEAAAARPHLDQVARELGAMLDPFPGAWLEEKGLTLSLHYRALAGEHAAPLIADVEERVSSRPDLHLTRGKMVLEVRPRVDWHKGRAALFLLDQLNPPPGAPVLYFGDDTTDEDAFVALRDWRGEGEGVLVADSVPPASAARSYLRSPAEVGEQLVTLAAAPRLPGVLPSG